MPDTHTALIDSATADLTHALMLIKQELRAYPTPISGCDQQYMHLLSERRRLEIALDALRRRPFVASPRRLEPLGALGG